ncbi:MBL fold metallo-hydrolase [Vibrio astriarenae]
MQHSVTGHSFSTVLLGCGDAYDAKHHNSGLLVSQCSYNLLIDCGPWLTRRFLDSITDPDLLDAVYITHAHPDHALGLTTLTNWMDSKRRTKPFIIYVQREQKRVIEALVRYAHWPSASLGYRVEYHYVEETSVIGPWRAQFAPTRHAISNMSIHLTNRDGHSLFYSGDGELCEEGASLAAISDWVYVECQTFDLHHSHGSLVQIRELDKKADSRWFLYHIDPMERTKIRTSLAQQNQMRLAEEGLLVADHDRVERYKN